MYIISNKKHTLTKEFMRHGIVAKLSV